MFNKRYVNPWTVILAILSLVGLGAWVYQLANGLIATGMRNVVSWGLYITLFMFFVGLSAGGLIVSSSATVFNIKQFKPVAKPAVLLSSTCIIVATLLIFVDLGRPDRFLNLVFHPQFNSPLIWDVIVIGIYLVTSLVYLYSMTREEPNLKNIKVLSAIALPVAILVHSVTAWIFGLQIARPTWHSALMAPLFVASALDSGLALLLLVLIGLNQFTSFKVDKKLISTLGGLLAVFIAVDVYFVFSEILTALYPGEEQLMGYLTLMLSGSLAPFFWGEIILGAVVPFLILVVPKNRLKSSLMLLASGLVVVGVLFKRIWLLFSSLLLPLIGLAPGVTLGAYQMPETFGQAATPGIWATVGSYAPTWVELAIVVGVCAFGALIFTVGTYFFLTPVQTAEALPKQGGAVSAT
ncbi:NrfD/PsrC family molybdoenzyme membrane anchor subunit [Paradesulfitobacterium ferrireducens]|uniref:NrfD/PsrC family molybdoenzyme membrane anchor subunit n=1 Tax=Paradesulfitobacterium ferrireducens TaxID=2816476 RepID=UPI002E2DCD33|nr:NrfD/PsrC family molybdoenzyme membrane anchor subunit [Paradesulfitobacterium ferrireducens]